MKIQIDRHSLERAEERGADEREIEDVIKNGFDCDVEQHTSTSRINDIQSGGGFSEDV
jgi:hypothetical protein